MNEMKCPFCGKDIPDDSNFCPECGKRVKAKISKKSLIVILSLVAVAVIVALVLLLSNKSSDSDDEKKLTPKEDAIAWAKKRCECEYFYLDTNIREYEKCLKETEEAFKILQDKYNDADSLDQIEFDRTLMEYKCENFK